MNWRANPIGPLAGLRGVWKGHGFNQIWRPFHGSQDHFLELNETNETLQFEEIPGDIPNRGLLQADINLHGLRYLQQIQDANVLGPNGKARRYPYRAWDSAHRSLDHQPAGRFDRRATGEYSTWNFNGYPGQRSSYHQSCTNLRAGQHNAVHDRSAAHANSISGNVPGGSDPGPHAAS